MPRPVKDVPYFVARTAGNRIVDDRYPFVFDTGPGLRGPSGARQSLWANFLFGIYKDLTASVTKELWMTQLRQAVQSIREPAKYAFAHMRNMFSALYVPSSEPKKQLDCVAFFTAGVHVFLR